LPAVCSIRCCVALPLVAQCPYPPFPLRLTDKATSPEVRKRAQDLLTQYTEEPTPSQLAKIVRSAQSECADASLSRHG